MKVRITTTYKATATIEVSDDFDPEHDDLLPRQFEADIITRLNHDGMLDRVGVLAEYDFA